MRETRTIRLALKLLWLTFFLGSGYLLSAQPVAPQGYFKVKNNAMYIILSRSISQPALDSFINKYSLADIGLGQLISRQINDSLIACGWAVDKSDSKLYIIRKPLEGVPNFFQEPGKSVYSPVPTPEDWRVVGGNRVIYGKNDFKKPAGFKTENGIVYFELTGHAEAKKVRLAGNFTNWQWQAFPMTKTASGWSVAVKLNPGKYYYKFILDNSDWITDPDNRLTENDGRGNENSVYYVTNKSFELKGYPDAREVFLAGSFNNWAKHKLPMKKEGADWKLDLYLDSGTYSYKFIVDGKAVADNGPGGDGYKLAIGKDYEFFLKGFSDAKQVMLAGNFNDWHPDELKMEKTSEGWKLHYVLGPGNYQYKFIVDGRWITDPANNYVIRDTKGNDNSFLIVGANYKFRLKGFQTAGKIFLAGDFNEWSPEGLPMRKVGDEWVCPVYLAPGKHLYKFVVDGKWILDPANKSWEENEYGTGNSVIWIEKEV